MDTSDEAPPLSAVQQLSDEEFQKWLEKQALLVQREDADFQEALKNSLQETKERKAFHKQMQAQAQNEEPSEVSSSSLSSSIIPIPVAMPVQSSVLHNASPPLVKPAVALTPAAVSVVNPPKRGSGSVVEEFVQLIVEIPTSCAGLIFGKGKSNLRALEIKFGVTINVPLPEGKESVLTFLVVEGRQGAATAVQEDIQKNVTRTKSQLENTDQFLNNMYKRGANSNNSNNNISGSSGLIKGSRIIGGINGDASSSNNKSWVSTVCGSGQNTGSTFNWSSGGVASSVPGPSKVKNIVKSAMLPTLPPVAPPRFPVRRSGAGVETVHIFVDHSNLAIGAQRLSDGSKDRSVAINLKAVAALLLNGRPCPKKIVAASFKEAQAEMVEVVKGWESQGYKVHLRQRVSATVALLEDGKRCPNTHISVKAGPPVVAFMDNHQRCPNRHIATKESVEDGVDDLIHAQINMQIALNSHPPTRQTLVLVTGDGNPNPSKYRPNTYGTTFVDCCAVAFRLGWEVELWSWRNSLNSVYHAMAREHRDRMKICYFDDHRALVCPKTTQYEPVVIRPSNFAPFLQGSPAKSTFQRLN